MKTSAHIKWVDAGDNSPLGNVQDGFKLELTFHGEVLDGKMLLPVVGQALVERAILLGRNILGISRPEGLGLVKLLVFGLNFLDLLRLFLFRLIIFDLLDFRFALLLGLFFFVIFNFL